MLMYRAFFLSINKGDECQLYAQTAERTRSNIGTVDIHTSAMCAIRYGVQKSHVVKLLNQNRRWLI